MQAYCRRREPDQRVAIDGLAVDEIGLHLLGSERQRRGLFDEAPLNLSEIAADLRFERLHEITKAARARTAAVDACEELRAVGDGRSVGC